jgi:hypothetical protein
MEWTRLIPHAIRTFVGALGCLLVLSLAIGSGAAGAAECPPISVVLRYDDYTARSPLALERELLAGVERLGSSVIVGVVPFWREANPPENGTAGLSREKIELLADYAARGIAELAVHGYRHLDQALPGAKSEFAGVPSEVQAHWVREAKHAVETAFGRPVAIFVPPWNRHDEHTVAALEAAGYGVLSSSQTQPVLADAALSYLPGTVYPQDFAATIDALRADGQCGGLVVVTSHPYDFELERPLPGFRTGSSISVKRFLEQLRQRAEAGVIDLVGVGDLLRRREDLGALRFSLNHELRYGAIAAHSLLPYRLGLHAPPGVYFDTADARRRLLGQQAVLVLIYGGTLGVAFVGPIRLSRRARTSFPLWLLGLGVVLAVTAAALCRMRAETGVFWALPCALVAGLALGLLVSAAGGALASRVARRAKE